MTSSVDNVDVSCGHPIIQQLNITMVTVWTRVKVEYLMDQFIDTLSGSHLDMINE